MLRIALILLCLAILAGDSCAQDTESSEDASARLRELVSANQPAGSNGYELFQAIAPRVERIEQDLVDLGCYFGYFWSNADLDPAERHLRLRQINDALSEARESGLFDEFAALAATDNLIPPSMGEWMGDQQADFLSPTRCIARINAARFVLGLALDDRAEVLAAVRESFWLSRRTAAFAHQYPFMSGAASELLILGRIREGVLDHGIDGELAAALLGELAEAPSMLAATTVYEGDRLLRRRDIGLLYSQRGELVPDRLRQFSTIGLDPSAFDPKAPGDPSFPAIDQMLAWEQEFFEMLPGIAHALPKDRPAVYEQLSEAWDIFKTDEPHERARSGVYLAVMPAAGPLADFADNAALNLAATRIMLAIEIYRESEGTPPPALTALVPGILSVLPADPFSGEPLVYLPDPDASLGYILYSVGYDATDDGARPWPEPGHGYRVLSFLGAGYDLVFTSSEERE